MPHTLVYWAPEVLRLERYSTAADMWALGITMYQVVTGEHPFNVTNEEHFRDDLFTANVDWSRLAGYPRLKMIIENLLRVDPYKRWDSNMVLAYAQEFFVIDIQRAWRGCKFLVLIGCRFLKKGIQKKVQGTGYDSSKHERFRYQNEVPP
jgi:serine/threonine protein kinase